MFLLKNSTTSITTKLVSFALIGIVTLLIIATNNVTKAQSLSPQFTNISLTENTFNECKSSIKSAFELVPAEHLENLDTIYLHQNPDWRRGMANATEIYLKCLENENELKSVFVHELGHIVDVGQITGSSSTQTNYSIENFPVLSDDISLLFYKVSWIESYSRKLNSYLTDFVSEYATENHFEDFAESYAYYILHGPDFRLRSQGSFQLAQKYLYLKIFIFNNVEYKKNTKSIVLTNSTNPAIIDQPYDVTKLAF